MDRLTRDDLRQVFEFEKSPCLTLMMPTHRTGPEMRQDPIRFRNLWSQAEDALVDGGLHRPQARELLRPIASLQDDWTFWQTQGDGLAIFAADGFLRIFRLPLKLEETVAVADRFDATPLVPLVQNEGRFYVVALTLHKVRFLEADRQQCREIEIEGVPQGMDEALAKEYEQSIQWHSEQGWTYSRGGEEIALFHGQSDSNPKRDILEYCRAVDRPLSKWLAGNDEPLVFAGVEYLSAIYREANSYPHLTEECVTGSFDGTPAGELHELALKVVEPIFRVAQDRAIEHYNERVGAGVAGNDLGEILTAACDGAVDALLLARGAQQWGTFDAARRNLSLHHERQDGGEDLLDRAAAETIRHGGEVFVLEPGEVPGGGPCAAVYRYAVSQPQQQA